MNIPLPPVSTPTLRPPNVCGESRPAGSFIEWMYELARKVLL